ncbi:MAG: hypothetical protein HC769_30740 [Cyanobacteria bacterium CRU_2_1]|nr:hypothetical protein [Cyanobacteria bacterium CRU_2_1]
MRVAYASETGCKTQSILATQNRYDYDIVVTVRKLSTDEPLGNFPGCP